MLIILGLPAIVFAFLALFSVVQNGGRWGPLSKVWTIIAVVFAVVALLLRWNK